MNGGANWFNLIFKNLESFNRYMQLKKNDATWPNAWKMNVISRWFSSLNSCQHACEPTNGVSIDADDSIFQHFAWSLSTNPSRHPQNWSHLRHCADTWMYSIGWMLHENCDKLNEKEYLSTRKSSSNTPFIHTVIASGVGYFEIYTFFIHLSCVNQIFFVALTWSPFHVILLQLTWWWEWTRW